MKILRSLTGDTDYIDIMFSPDEVYYFNKKNGEYLKDGFICFGSDCRSYSENIREQRYSFYYKREKKFIAKSKINMKKNILKFISFFYKKEFRGKDAGKG